jgi:hypothetical protein
LKALTKHTPPTTLELNYHDFYELISEKFHDSDLIDSPFHFEPYTTMNQLIAHSTEHMKMHFITYLHTLLLEIPTAPENQRSSMIGIITQILQRFPFEARDHLELLCALLFQILQDLSAPLYTETMIAFSALIAAAPDQCGQFAGPLIRAIRGGFESGIPAVVGKSALTLGDLFKALGRRSVEFLSDEIELLFGLLEKPNAREEVSNVLKGMSLVIDGIQELAKPWAPRFWEVALEWGSADFNADSKGDVIFAAEVFDGVAALLSSVVRVIAMEGKNVEFEKDVKKRLFPLFDRMWTLQAFSDESLFSVCTLLESLLTNLNKAVNIQLQRKTIKYLLDVAKISSDRQLSRGAIQLENRLKKA